MDFYLRSFLSGNILSGHIDNFMATDVVLAGAPFEQESFEVSHGPVVGTFTADLANNRLEFTIGSHGLADETPVIITGPATAPTPLVKDDVVYYVIPFNTSSIQLGASPAGSAIDLSGTAAAGNSVKLAGTDFVIGVGSSVQVEPGTYQAQLNFTGSGPLGISHTEAITLHITDGRFLAPFHQVATRRDLVVLTRTGEVTGYYFDSTDGLLLTLGTDVDAWILFQGAHLLDYPDVLDSSTLLRLAFYPENDLAAPPVFEVSTTSPVATEFDEQLGLELHAYPLPFRFDSPLLQRLARAFYRRENAQSTDRLRLTGVLDYTAASRVTRTRTFRATLSL